MKVTMSQLKRLIREATEEAMDECSYEEESVKEAKNEKEEESVKTEVAELQEAVAAAFRAGLRRGRTTTTAAARRRR